MRRIIVIASILLLMFGGTISYLSCTEGGLRLLFSASAKIVPAEVSVTSLTGRLIGPIKIAGLRYRTEGLMISIDQCAMDWKPLELFSLRAHIATLAASGVNISAGAGKEAPPSEPGLPDLRLPLEIVIEDTRVSAISLTSRKSGGTFEIDEVSLDAHLGRKEFRIHRLDVTAPLFALTLAGDLIPEGDYPLDIDVEWSLSPPGYTPVTASGRLSGSLARLVVTQKTDSPVKALIAATLFSPLEELRWEASLHIEAFQGGKIREGWPDVALTGDAGSSGTPAEFNLQGSFSASWPEYGRVTGDFLGGHREGEWKLEKLLLAVPGMDTRITLRGAFSQVAGLPSFTVAGKWQDVSWPLHGKEAGYVSPDGMVTARGSLEDFSFRGNLRLEGKSIPPGKWVLSGKRKGGEINLDMVKGSILGGVVAGNGVFRWQPEMEWSATIDGRKIDPGAFAEKWPGSLSFALRSTGELQDEQPRAKIEITSLTGELRGYPVRGSAHIAIAGNRFTLPRVELRSGTALFSVSGEVSDRWDVGWHMDAKDLRELIPDGGGSVKGNGRLSGPRRLPKIEAVLVGRGVAAGTAGAEVIEASIDLDLSDSEDSRFDVTLSGMNAGARKFDLLSIKASGKLVSHDLSAALQKERDTFTASLSGRYESGSWEGMLTRSDFSTERFGTWSLSEKGAISLSAAEAQTEELCFESGPSSICSRIEWMREKGAGGKITIAKLPLSLFGPALPEKVALEGTLTGSIEGAYATGEEITGTIGLTTTPGEVAYSLEEGKTVTLPFTGSEFYGSLDREALHARLNVTVSDEESVTGTLTLPLFSPLNIQPEKQVLSGSAEISLEERGLAPLLFPQLENTSGRLLGDLTFSGTLANPFFTGEVALTRAAADIPGLGTRIEDFRVAVSSDGSGLIKIDGEARSGEGTLGISGEVDIKPRNGQTVRLTIKGERFEAIKTPEAWILASPDFTMQLTGKVLSLGGQLEIPEATIEPRDLSGAVTPSRDVAVIREDEETEKEDTLKVYTNVRVTLGEKVSFNGFGLSGRITGSILAVDEPEKLTTATGELMILQGKYKAYGQKLEIEKGRVIFFGGPVDDPGLDIRAVRRIDEVVAGVDVSGTVKSPRLKLFSEPAMDQSDALSYLLLGRPLNSASSSEGKELQNAALSAGLSGGDLIAKKIGAVFGLEEVGIEEGTGDEEASLVVGKYLSPRLYISYGIGLFEPISIYRIQYNISRRWLVQTEYGLNSGADLFYKIEW